MKQINNRDQIVKLVYAALFAALVCVSTMIVQIPTPTKGYFNLGDMMVLLSGWILGPVYGVAAAAIGSMFADIFASYFIYAPATFIVKAIVAFLSYYIAQILHHFVKKHMSIVYVISGTIAELAMVFGYFLFEATVAGYGFAGAALSIPNNMLQGIAGVVIGTIMISVLNKTQITGKVLNKHRFVRKDV